MTAAQRFIDDPDWAKGVPVLASGGARPALPAHEDCTPLDVEETAVPLLPGGALGAMPGYEARPGQIDALRAVARAFNAREHLMIEAGTGVGKSLAYLLPSVRWAAQNNTSVIVSTATRNLQSQLVTSDIPRALRTLPEDVDCRVALLKGRANYLCLKALEEVMQDGYFALTGEEREDFERLVDWFARTEDGDLDFLDAPHLRPRLFCSGEDCGGRGCPFRAKCFVQKARARALRAHLVVANHALVLADASGEGGILPAYGRIVFDEAHNLEDVATEFFSSELSRLTFRQLMNRLERRRRGRETPKGLLGTVDRQIARESSRGRLGAVERAHELVFKVRVAAKAAMTEADALFAILEQLFAPAPAAESIRFRVTAEGARQHSENGLFRDYTREQWDEDLARRGLIAFEGRLAAVVDALAELGAAIAALDGEDDLPLHADLAEQVASVAGSFRDYLLSAKFVLAGSDESHAYWAEKNRETGLRVVAAPLSVADELRRCFLAVKDSVVFCSATLRVGDRFDYLKRRLGVDERARQLVAASPFDYFRQMSCVAAAFLPDPAADAEGYAARLAPLLGDLFAATRGRGLVLFTAYDMMRQTAAAAAPLLAARGVELIVQGSGLTREAMVARLRAATEDRPVALFGSQSFWEGVDVAGAALSCVVIARLPFPQVREPIVEARAERIVAAGGSSFRDYFLPEAVIKFRQGFGRLVRTKRDRGMVVVADPRIASKNYGGVFRKSVPATVHVARSPEDLLARWASVDTPRP